MVVASWVTGVLFFGIAITIRTLDVLSEGDWKQFMLAVPTIGLITTNITFVSVYTYIYIKYRQAAEATRSSLYQNRKAKIFAPFVICVSFFLFGTLPHFFEFLISNFRYTYLWFYTDGISNFFVYVFMNEKIQRRWKKWRNKNNIGNV